MIRIQFRVRYHETDAMGVVHHAAYITWFEEGRSAFTRAMGCPYAEMEAQGIGLVAAEVRARYHRAARYDEKVAATTCLAALRSRGMTFTYEVRCADDDTLLASGSTDIISVDPSGRVRRLPDEVRTRFALDCAVTNS